MNTTTLKPSRVAVNTGRYYASHCQEPRGRGGWIFEDYRGEVVWRGPSMTYAEARKAACAAAAALGVGEIFTCP